MILILFALLPALASFGEEKVRGDETSPEPYQKEEFPQWARDLRRAEIIFFGSVPFTLFFSLESYDMYRYVSHNFDSSYSPWPFAGYNSIPYSTEENIGVIIGALSISAVIATVDFFLGKIQRND